MSDFSEFRVRYVFATKELAEAFAKEHASEFEEQGIKYIVVPYGYFGEYSIYLSEPENDAKESTMPKKNDNVNHPSHYETNGIECIDAMVASQGAECVMNYCLCNAFKYIWRCQHKGKRVEDIQKAVWYLNKWQELAEDETKEDENDGRNLCDRSLPDVR